MSIVVERVVSPGAELTAAMRRLVDQLVTRPVEVTPDVLREALISDRAAWFVARQGEEIVGTATVVLVPMQGSLVGWVEDLVVDRAHRRRRTGEELLRALAAWAQAAGATTLQWTCQPFRREGNRLYGKIGAVRTTVRVDRAN